MMNKSVILTEVLLLLSTVCQYGDRYMIPYNLQINLKLPASQTGLFISIGALACFLFSPLANYMIRKLTSRLGLIIFYFVYFVLDLINSF